LPKPLCFMIMPYGRKATQAEAGRGVPEIDFNALWDHAFAPTIIGLGYEAVRADQDTGALIVTQMLERLYFAELVLADMTIPNGNVYYEVGVRHAAKEKGCVLLAADWSKQLFDVAQMRTIRYPLTDGAVGDASAKAVQEAIKSPIAKLARSLSPMHDAIKGYPNAVDPAKASTMKDVMVELAAFQGQIRAVRALPRASRFASAKDLADRYAKPPVTPSTALSLLLILRDSADTAQDWQWITDFLGTLPADIGEIEEVREIAAFAVANGGRPIEAIAKLEALIAVSGPTPERLGLLGGRYKRLAAATATPFDKAAQLNRCIEAYEKGMQLDLNQYYCASNLPRLYRQRKRKGDDERARSVSNVVVVACERARSLGSADEWLRPTLLGAAFDAGDSEKAEELAADVAAEGAARWKLDSLLGDLRASVAQVEDKERRERLGAILESLTPASG
jgi:MAP3K TRAFs-binding domain